MRGHLTTTGLPCTRTACWPCGFSLFAPSACP